jgi:hypothetical protein
MRYYFFALLLLSIIFFSGCSSNTPEFVIFVASYSNDYEESVPIEWAFVEIYDGARLVGSSFTDEQGLTKKIVDELELVEPREYLIKVEAEGYLSKELVFDVEENKPYFKTFYFEPLNPLKRLVAEDLILNSIETSEAGEGITYCAEISFNGNLQEYCYNDSITGLQGAGDFEGRTVTLKFSEPVLVEFSDSEKHLFISLITEEQPLLFANALVKVGDNISEKFLRMPPTSFPLTPSPYLSVMVEGNGEFAGQLLRLKIDNINLEKSPFTGEFSLFTDAGLFVGKTFAQKGAFLNLMFSDSAGNYAIKTPVYVNNIVKFLGQRYFSQPAVLLTEPLPDCGDGICDVLESDSICPQDCAIVQNASFENDIPNCSAGGSEVVPAEHWEI